MLANIDLSDGFWRMIVEEEDKFNFVYVVLDLLGTPTRLVVPSDLKMGWADIQAYICTATETGRDLIHQTAEKKSSPHPQSRGIYAAN